MVAPAVEGIDLFKIAGRSISGWIPSLKTGSTVRQPFCSQLEERLLVWLEYHPLVASYARGDIDPQFATKYRLPIPKHAPFAIGYTFEDKPHHYLPDVVGTLSNGQPFIAEAGMEDDKRGDRNLAKAEAARRLARLQQGHLLLDLEQFTLSRTLPLALLHPSDPVLVPSPLPDTLLPEPDTQSKAPASRAPFALVPGPTFDASRLPEPQREQFHRILRAV